MLHRLGIGVLLNIRAKAANSISGRPYNFPSVVLNYVAPSSKTAASSIVKLAPMKLDVFTRLGFDHEC